MGGEVLALFILGVPTACIAWTVTHEEIFRELREWCGARSRASSSVWSAKFYYVFTCEYCFSHYVAAAVLAATGYRLLFDDWRGYAIGWLSIVWVANTYMSLFGRLRLDIKREGVDIAVEQQELRREGAGPAASHSSVSPTQASPAGPSV